MKRDMELVRKILLATEAADGQPDLTPLVNEGWREKDIKHHTALLYSAGLVEGTLLERSMDPEDVDECFISGLSWSGHDFIANAAKNPNWDLAKSRAMETVGGLTIDTMKAALAYVAQKAITGDWS